MGVDGVGTGGRGREILGRGLYQNLLYFTDFMYFNAITGYQYYILLKQIQAYLQ